MTDVIRVLDTVIALCCSVRQRSFEIQATPTFFCGMKRGCQFLADFAKVQGQAVWQL